MPLVLKTMVKLLKPCVASLSVSHLSKRLCLDSLHLPLGPLESV
uniref:Sp140 nuclear body protein n=1 Tax=Mus musculus TaxID=10090 RepID=D3Z054_MOUSE